MPIDDQSCWVYVYSWNPDRPLTDRENRFIPGVPSVHAEVDENWVPIRNRGNDYLIDREAQKTRSFTGIEGLSEQDAAIQDSQGFIADRTREHLGPTDLGIVRFRRPSSAPPGPRRRPRAIRRAIPRRTAAAAALPRFAHAARRSRSAPTSPPSLRAQQQEDLLRAPVQPHAAGRSASGRRSARRP